MALKMNWHSPMPELLIPARALDPPLRYLSRLLEPLRDVAEEKLAQHWWPPPLLSSPL